MTARMNHTDRLEVSSPDVIVVSSAPQLVGSPTDGADAAPTLVHRPQATVASRLRQWLLPFAVLLVTAVAILVALLAGADKQVVAEPGNQPRVAQPAPARAADAVRLTVEAPATVVAGKPAAFTVNYEAPSGQFSGSTEEWGDGLGTSSVKHGRCDGAHQASSPLGGRYTVSHTWTKPGAYEVALGVNTYSCVGSEQRELQGKRTLTVNVVAP